ncbi:hypothetical protein [Actinomarinicola tropica]|uniref:hypothetical protein n=1 Tax=Actinomarinicola tropica TaxID=2789776 RepID=UPI001E34B8AD|nr:hypothetical protein [Actinomarinicola tropica]
MKREDGWYRDRVSTGPYLIDWTAKWAIRRPPDFQGEWTGYDGPTTMTATFETETLPGWRVEIEYRLSSGAIRPVRTVTTAVADDPDPGPLYRALGGRRLDVQLEREFRQDMVQMMLPADWKGAAFKRRQVGRRPLSDAELVEHCLTYLAFCESDPDRPTKAWSESESWLSYDTVQGWLRAAERRGLFSRAGHGKAGGMLTAKAREIMEVLKEQSRGEH